MRHPVCAPPPPFCARASVLALRPAFAPALRSTRCAFVVALPRNRIRRLFYNINYGRISASREEVIEAAQRAQIHATATRMPDGYDTLVGERGLKLSGGEKQRVALARAFLKDAEILVCDEATSALDTRTEREIMLSLMELAKGRTTIFVAHRLSTVMHCDEIVVMDHGRVAERGSHDELVEASKYARISGLPPPFLLGSAPHPQGVSALFQFCIRSRPSRTALVSGLCLSSLAWLRFGGKKSECAAFMKDFS